MYICVYLCVHIHVNMCKLACLVYACECGSVYACVYLCV